MKSDSQLRDNVDPDAILLIEIIKNNLKKIDSIFLRLFVIETKDGIRPCSFCESFKKSDDFILLHLLGEKIGLRETHFEIKIIEVDWVDKFLSSDSYTRRLSPAGRMWYACRATHIYHYPTIELDLVLRGEKTDSDKVLIDQRWNSIGKKQEDGSSLVTIFVDVLSFIKNALLNIHVEEMVKPNSKSQRRYIVGNDPMKKKTAW